jgi:hypothetical protein
VTPRRQVIGEQIVNDEQAMIRPRIPFDFSGCNVLVTGHTLAADGGYSITDS